MANFLPIPPTNAVSDPQARAALDALSQNIQIAIDTFATKASVTSSSTAVATTVGNTYGNIVGSSVNNTPLAPAYTRAKLTQDLETGAASIISNGNTSDNIMKTGLNYIVFQNKNAIPLGSTGAYTGTVRTALGLLSTGIVGGYNDPSTGNWVSSITIDTSTGNLNVLGTIKANSIISASAYLDSTLVSTVVSNASSALYGLSNKLNKSASDILSGTVNLTGAGAFATGSISVSSSGVASGSGVAITSRGIVGLNSGTPTFSVDATTGAATFKGDITANSIISASAYLGTDTVSTVLGNISTANSNAAAALAAVTAKLNNSAADILSGPISFSTYGGFKTSGMTIAVDGTATGQGVAFTSKGIVGRNSTTTTFTIDSTTGNATFGGTLTAATGTFYGDIIGGANIRISGNATFDGNNSGPSGSSAAILANTSFAQNAGVEAYTNNTFLSSGALRAFNSQSGGGNAIYAYQGGTGNAVLGQTANGIGIYGTGTIGVQGSGTNGVLGFGTTGNSGVLGQTLGTGFGVYSYGIMGTNNNSFVSNLYSQYTQTVVGTTSNQLRFVSGTSTGSGVATFASTSKPGGTTTNVWMTIQIDATTFYIPVWT